MRVTPTWTGRSALLLLALALAHPARAYFLDRDGNFDFRARLYTEGAAATEASEPQTVPARKPFQVIEHRTFFNPELEGKLTPYQPFGLDDLSFRFALWGFYDGVYDYLTSQYDRSRLNLKARFSQGHTETAPFSLTDHVRDLRKVYTYQPDPVLGSDNQPGDVADLPFRLNEAYFNLTQGSLFARVGRQTISWGESDTIALLDQSNPFNVTMGLPGIFQDIDEARIPLWTLRTTYKLFENWRFLSGGYVDTYLVPGSIDTTVSQVPVPTASPYSPAGNDPQAFIDNLTGFIPAAVRDQLIKAALGGIQFVQYDQLPSRTMANSRYGARVGALVARDYTTSLWFYRTIAQNPVPVFRPLDLSRAPVLHPGAAGPTQLVTSTVHGLTSVFGGSLSFFSSPLDGIVRGEVEYFLDEPAFIPNVNIPFENLTRSAALRKFLVPLGAKVKPGPIAGFVPRADAFRWEIGYDRFFFARKLNPNNSFVWVSALVGDWNLSETFTDNDYRYYGQQKASDTGVKTGANTKDLKGITDVGKLHTVATDFVDKYEVEWLLQSSLQTDYLHGKLQPRLTVIANPRGTFAFPMTVTYRYSDNLLFDLRYTILEGGFFGTGFFRDRDQVAARVTLLLN